MKRLEDVAFIFGEHKENMPPEILAKSKQEGTCILCDGDLWFTGDQTGIDKDFKPVAPDDPMPKKRKKLIATSCFMVVHQMISAMIFREFQAHQKLQQQPSKPKDEQN